MKRWGEGGLTLYLGPQFKGSEETGTPPTPCLRPRHKSRSLWCRLAGWGPFLYLEVNSEMLKGHLLVSLRPLSAQDSQRSPEDPEGYRSNPKTRESLAPGFRSLSLVAPGSKLEAYHSGH